MSGLQAQDIPSNTPLPSSSTNFARRQITGSIYIWLLLIIMLMIIIIKYVVYSKTKKTIIIYKPVIKKNTISCKVNFKGKKIVLKNEYFGVNNLYEGVEGFLSLFIPHILLTNDSIIVKGEVCRKFYNNLLHLKKYYDSLNIGPTYFNINCSFKKLDYYSNLRAKKRGTITTFTGGVDSFYTLLTKLNEIDTILYCINYDVFESQQHLLKMQLQTIKNVAHDLKKNVIICRTNQRSILQWSNIGYLKDISHKYDNDLWGYFIHGPCIFSNAYNLSLEYNKLYIPSSHPKTSNYLWGSSFHIDHFYSSSFLDIVHHGDCTRVHKIRQIITINKNICFKYLKVCYSNSNQKYNCSKCEKCKRTFIPIGIINKNYLKELKTFNIDIEKFEEIKNEYLNFQFKKNTDKDFQNEIKTLVTQTSFS